MLHLRTCEHCHEALLRHTLHFSSGRLLRQVFTYNAQDWGEGNSATQGGYSDSYVIDHRCGTGNQSTKAGTCLTGGAPHV